MSLERDRMAPPKINQRAEWPRIMQIKANQQRFGHSYKNDLCSMHFGRRHRSGPDRNGVGHVDRLRVQDCNPPAEPMRMKPIAPAGVRKNQQSCELLETANAPHRSTFGTARKFVHRRTISSRPGNQSNKRSACPGNGSLAGHAALPALARAQRCIAAPQHGSRKILIFFH